MKSKAFSLLKNRFVQIGIAFVVGGFIATLLLPEKITIKTKTKVEYVDRVVEVEKVVIKEVEVVREVEIFKKVRVVKHKETFPNGRIVETEIYESESEQIDRMRRLEQEKYEEKFAMIEKEYREEVNTLKEHVNPKRFTVFGGVGTRLTDFQKHHFLGGVSYPLFGPFIIGAQVTTNTDVSVTFGLRF